MKKVIKLLNANGWIILLVGVLFLSTYIKIAEIKGGNFPFTTDQGRDMVDIRHMVVAYAPRLVGPTTSINGVLLGPFWYYFNLIPFMVGGGDPNFIMYWQILWYQLSVIILWLVLRKRNNSLASIVSVFLFLMPTGFNTARYFWNANSMVFFTTIYFASLITTVRNKTKPNLLLLGLFAGLAMQVEAAFGILFFPFALIYLFFCHSGLETRLSSVGRGESIPLVTGFVLTLLPQALFELKHQFIMTKILLGEFSGNGAMLGEKISFSERLTQRWDHLHALLLNSSHLPPNYIPTLFALGLLAFLFVLATTKLKSEQNKLWSLPVWFTIFCGVFYLLIFKEKLKIWYTLGLSIPVVLFFSSFVNYFFEHKIKILKTIPILIMGLAIFYTYKSQFDYIQNVSLKPSDDRSNLRNELTALDWVYQNANGSGFKVYSYLPSVYDFPYNHLFWWYGNQKYGYEPAETAYLPGQPEYIQDVDKIWTNKRNLDSKDLTFLIIEEDMDMPSRTVTWLGNFSKLCLLKEQVFPWHAKVQMRSTCIK